MLPRTGRPKTASLRTIQGETVNRKNDPNRATPRHLLRVPTGDPSSSTRPSAGTRTITAERDSAPRPTQHPTASQSRARRVRRARTRKNAPQTTASVAASSPDTWRMSWSAGRYSDQSSAATVRHARAGQPLREEEDADQDARVEGRFHQGGGQQRPRRQSRDGGEQKHRNRLPCRGDLIGRAAEREVFGEAAAIAPPLRDIEDDRPPVGGFTRVQIGRMAPDPSGVHDQGEKQNEGKDVRRVALDPLRYGFARWRRRRLRPDCAPPGVSPGCSIGRDGPIRPAPPPGASP